MPVITPTRYTTTQRQLVNAAKDALRFWVARNPHASPERIVEEAQAIARRFGAKSAAVAREYYNTERAAAAAEVGIDGPYFHALRYVDTRPDEASRRLSTALKKHGLGGVEREIDVLIEDHGRRTIMSSVQAERRARERHSGRPDPGGPRWARKPIGPTCAWCLTLASRGAVFWTKESAGGGRGGRFFHADCDCQPVPVWPGQNPPYDAARLYDIYVQSRTASGDRTLGFRPDGSRIWERDVANRAVAQAMRQHFPGLVNDGVGPTILRSIPSLPHLDERLARDGANPGYPAAGTTENCTRVVHAYEMRRRGYDVAAGRGQMTDEIALDWADLMEGLDDRLVASWRHAASLDVHLSAGDRRTTTDPMAYVRTTAQRWPVGARGYVVIDRGASAAGHIINVERTAEGLRLTEAQNPRSRTTLADYLGQIPSQTTTPATPEEWVGGSIMIARVDDLRFTEKVTEAVTWNGKTP